MSEKETAPEVSREDQAPEDPVQADYNKGKELLEAGDDAQAASFFHNALVGFEQKGDDNGVANASARLGDICCGRKDHEKALAHYRKALAICEREKDMYSQVALHKKMAASNRALKQGEAAVKNYLKIIDIYGGYNNPSGTVDAMEDLAGIYLEMGKRQQAADTYRTIASIHKNFSHNIQSEEFLQKAEQVEQEAS